MVSPLPPSPRTTPPPSPPLLSSLFSGLTPGGEALAFTPLINSRVSLPPSSSCQFDLAGTTDWSGHNSGQTNQK